MSTAQINKNPLRTSPIKQARLKTFFGLFSHDLQGCFRTVFSDGYSYPIPQPPQFDDPAPSPPAPIYLPPPPLQDFPQVVPTYLPPQDEILPPFDDSIVISAPPSNQYLPPALRNTPLQVFNMSCLDAKDGSGFFRTLLRSTFLTRVFPVIETSFSSCDITPITSDTFRIDLDGHKLQECGVRTCNARMCLVLRMATVPGLRLAEDPLVTLQCTPQEAVVSHTKHLKLNTNSEQGRSSSRTISVASGGVQRRFETEMSLLKRGAGDGFDQQVQQGSAVRLGDDLLLNTVVKDGDGWRYSRMGAVTIRSAASQKSVVLVDENGCRSAAMKNICPQHPQQVTPLRTQLPFKAFLFQGAAPADDLLLSVRMIGCLRPRDCYYQSKICDDISNRNRIRRSALKNSSEMITETEFQFRVLPPVPTPVFGTAAEQQHSLNSLMFLILVTIVATSLICSLLVVLAKTVKKCLFSSSSSF